MAKNIKKKTQNKPVYMTISKANAHNTMTPNNAFMIGIGTEDSPEFIYPEELKPAIVTSSKKESDYKQAEKEASTFRNRSLAGHIGTGLGLDLGDKSLQNIATTAIGIPLVSTNPVTTTLIKPLIKGVGHVGKVLLDPTKALTGVGQATATTADIYGTIEGLRQVPNATKNIIQGNGTAMDYFNLATGLMGPFGTFNTLKAARFNPYLRQVTGYKNLGLEDGDRLNHIEQTTNNIITPEDDPVVQRMYETQRIRTQQMINQAEQVEDNLPNLVTQDNDVRIPVSNSISQRRNNYSATRWADEITNEARTQIRRNLGYSDDIDIDFDDEGRPIISRRGERIDQSGSSITNDIDELQRQDEEIDRITSMFTDSMIGSRLRALRDKNLLGRYIEKQTGKTLNDIADNYVLVDLQLVPINEIKTIMRNKGFKEEFINYSLQEFSKKVRSAVGNPSKANDIRGFTAHKYEPDFKTGTQEFKLNRVRTNPESGIKHIFENYFDIKYRMGRPFNDTSRINDSDKEILNELITMYNKDTSSNISFDDLQDVDKFADLRNYLRSKYTDKKLPGDINSLAWNDAEHFGEFKPFSTTSNYDASKVLKKTADMINSIPRGYSLAVDDTSYDSEMLKLIEVLKHRKNYGRNPGQLSVESLGSTSWGNDFHKEQIRIGDILNEYRDKLSQNDIDYIESIINRNPKGNPSPELINIIKQKYEILGEELSISMKKMWDRILQLDPSLKINTNTIEYEPFNERDAIRDIVFKGKTTPRIHRPDIRIHRNKYGGNNKIKFDEIKQNEIFKLKGGMAVPLDDKKSLFYLSGAKHEQGGIDVTPELEAEGGEVIKINPKSIKVVTAQKIMGGKSPAELVVNASTREQDKIFNKVFKYQEDFKDRHNLNDDGTSKAKFGILKKFKNWLKTSKYSKQIEKYKLGGQMKNKKKANLGLFNPNAYLWQPEIKPDKVTAQKPKSDELVKTMNEFREHYLYKPESETNSSVVVANTPKKSFGKQIHSNTKMYQPPGYLTTPKTLAYINPFWDYNVKESINLNRGDVPIPYKLEEEVVTPIEQSVETKVQTPIQAKSNTTTNTTTKAPIIKRIVPATTTTNKTSSTSVGQNITKSNTNYTHKLDTEFLNEVVNPDGSITNFRTGQTYFKDLNKIRRSPYSQLNLKTGQMEYAGYINPYGAEIQPTVYNNGPKGRQERASKERLLNAGDWINIGTNAAGALTNLITGIATPNIRYARMKDATPVIAPKISATVNTNAEESAIDEQYYDELKSIDENTSNSQVALNRKRNAAARRAAAKLKVRAAAENIRRDLINKGSILKGEYDKFNIQRQDQIDAYNAQADAAEFNANRTKVADSITGFVSDLAQGATGITNAVEKRQADRINTVLTYMGNPEINPEKFGEGFDKVYKQLYGTNPPKYISKKYNKKK